jgi:hypothetical protein
MSNGVIVSRITLVCGGVDFGQQLGLMVFVAAAALVASWRRLDRLL